LRYSEATVGRLSQLLILSSLSLVAGAALGQTGFIVEPWRKAPPPSVPAVAPQLMSDSGLPRVASPMPRKPELPPAEAVSAPARQKWSPPIVELLVDPWTKSPVAVPAARPRWVPSTSEIIDPWAGSELASERIASRPLLPTRSTIF
jgi:hypothetical protein